MNVYYAPMQGITDAPYRRAHAAAFGGIRKYFTPFLSPTQHDNLTRKEIRDVLPENNPGMEKTVPQILAKDAEHFLFAVQVLADMGWTEVNLNAGCPAGTVTAKGKGSGLLANPSALEFLLDDIYTKSPIPISIKTRMGWNRTEEFEGLLDIYNRYPVSELIVHARTRDEFYGPAPHLHEFEQLSAKARMPVIYNGDLFSASLCRNFAGNHPQISGVMIGRGLASNPALGRALAGGSNLSPEELRSFFNTLLSIYSEAFEPNAALGWMREFGKFMCCLFAGSGKMLKAIQKAHSLNAFLDVVDRLLSEYPMREDPGFVPDGTRTGHASTL